MSAPTLERTQAIASTWPEIPHVLRSLWRACMSKQQHADVARALTVNFIGVASAGEAAALRDATDRLQTRTPCRAFLLLLDDRATDNQAELAATTRCHGQLRDIVLEEIVLRLPQKALASMPGLIRPLLVNDLPNHLFWAAPWPAKDADFDTLADLCEHTVVDSRRFGNPARELQVLAERRQGGKRLTDLNWLRMRPWRRALAEAFERFTWRPGTTVKGSIHHGRRAAAAALLLADWLHDRLDAAFAIEPDGDAEAVGPDRVTLALDGVDVDVQRRGAQLVVHVTLEHQCLLPLALATSRACDGDLLAAAIDVG